MGVACEPVPPPPAAWVSGPRRPPKAACPASMCRRGRVAEPGRGRLRAGGTNIAVIRCRARRNLRRLPAALQLPSATAPVPRSPRTFKTGARKAGGRRRRRAPGRANSTSLSPRPSAMDATGGTQSGDVGTEVPQLPGFRRNPQQKRSKTAKLQSTAIGPHVMSDEDKCAPRAPHHALRPRESGRGPCPPHACAACGRGAAAGGFGN